MIEVLTTIEPFASSLDWYVAQFYLGSFHVNADTGKVKPWVLALWHAVEQGKEPTRLSWETLLDSARHVRQTDMCELIGVKPNTGAPKEPLDLNSENFEIVVQAVDFSFWAVTTRNYALIERLQQRFKETKLVQTAQRYH